MTFRDIRGRGETAKRLRLLVSGLLLFVALPSYGGSASNHCGPGSSTGFKSDLNLHGSDEVRSVEAGATCHSCPSCCYPAFFLSTFSLEIELPDVALSSSASARFDRIGPSVPLRPPIS